MLRESFPALDAIPRVRAGFFCRVPGLDMQVERDLALERLRAAHEAGRVAAGLDGMIFASAEQVHGNRVAAVGPDTRFPVTDADGLLTTRPGICLGIYVADCAAVFLADRQGRGIALVHSGKKGTELAIAAVAVKALCRAAAVEPSDLVAQISPCIRPPCYETDFAAEICRQLAAAGVRDVHDCGTCTASHPESYYSYRREKGLTGRMLAVLAIREAEIA